MKSTKTKKKLAPKIKPPHKRFTFNRPTGLGDLNINLPGIWSAPIHPGDPITVMWRLLTARSMDLFPDTVSAKIFLDAYDVLLYESGDVPLVALETSTWYYTTNDQAAPILSPNQATSNQLYALGNQTVLRLEVTSKKTGEVFIATNTLDVEPAPLVQWNWTGAQGTVDTDSAPPPPLTFIYNFVINHPYQLLGQITNIAQNRDIVVGGSIVIIETPEGSSTSTEVQTFPFSLQAVGAHEEFETSNITKNWTWIIPGVWVDNPEEPQTKTFLYSVKITYFDSYGNVYPDVEMAQYLSVNVNVTDAKKSYGIGAVAALAAGLIAGIFTFGIGTAVGTALAAGLGAQALDPPEPDPRYKMRIILPEEHRDSSIDDKRFIEVMSFVNSASTALELVDTLGDIQNRLLGARNARDKVAISLQRDSYSEAMRSLRKVATHIGSKADSAIRSVNKEQAFDSRALELTIRHWQRGGIPTQVRHGLLDQGCTIEALNSLESALNNPGVATLARDFKKALGLLTFHVLTVIRAVEQSASSVIGKAP